MPKIILKTEIVIPEKIVAIHIANTICESCYDQSKQLQILILKDTKYGTVGNLVCAECSTKFKVGDIVK